MTEVVFHNQYTFILEWAGLAKREHLMIYTCRTTSSWSHHLLQNWPEFIYDDLRHVQVDIAARHFGDLSTVT